MRSAQYCIVCSSSGSICKTILQSRKQYYVEAERQMTGLQLCASAGNCYEQKGRHLLQRQLRHAASAALAVCMPFSGRHTCALRRSRPARQPHNPACAATLPAHPVCPKVQQAGRHCNLPIMRLQKMLLHPHTGGRQARLCRARGAVT